MAAHVFKLTPITELLLFTYEQISIIKYFIVNIINIIKHT